MASAAGAQKACRDGSISGAESVETEEALDSRQQDAEENRHASDHLGLHCIGFLMLRSEACFAPFGVRAGWSSISAAWTQGSNR